MARILNELFDIDVGDAKRGRRFPGRLLQGAAELTVVVRLTDAAASASGRRLNEDGIPDLARARERLRFGLDKSVAAGHDRNAALFRHSARGVLIAEPFHRLDRRPDKLVAGIAAFFREMGVFGKETVTRMDRVDVGDFGRADNAVDFKIALVGARGPNTDGSVGELDVPRVAVRFAERDYRLDAEFAARANNAKRDFPAVGD